MKKKTGITGYVYDFSVDYDAIGVDDILDIHLSISWKRMTQYNRVFGFVNQILISAMICFCCSLPS